VAPLPEPEFHSLEIGNPAIVVEVLSPSTIRTDATVKLRGYFKVGSIQHYLIVDPEKRTVVHHKRAKGEAVKSRTVRKGTLALSPLGIKIRLADVFGPRAS
jgi:Uma2 family endonuclease